MAVALDSDAVIGFLDSADALHGVADAAIRDAAREQSLMVSAVTYAEVMTGVRLGHHDEEKAAGFFNELVSQVLPVDVPIADVAARLRARHRALRMPDALILATASRHPEIETVLSGDADAAKVADLDCDVHLLLAATGE